MYIARSEIALSHGVVRQFVGSVVSRHDRLKPPSEPDQSVLSGLREQLMKDHAKPATVLYKVNIAQLAKSGLKLLLCYPVV